MPLVLSLSVCTPSSVPETCITTSTESLTSFNSCPSRGETIVSLTSGYLDSGAGIISTCWVVSTLVCSERFPQDTSPKETSPITSNEKSVRVQNFCIQLLL